MKVILLEDVKGTGAMGQVVNVSNGHAKNFLIPRNLAAEATPNAIKDWESRKKSADTKRQNEITEARELAAKIEAASVKIPMKVGEGGKMFGSVGAKEIAAALASQAGIDIDRKKFVLDDPIKVIGEKSVSVKVYAEIAANLSVEIVEEE